MGYRSLAECVRDLETTGQLVVIDQEVDPYLEVAAIQRRVYQAAGPALLFRRAKGTAFPLLGNLFGTLDRAKYLFRDTLESVRRLVELKVEPGVLGKNPWRYRGVPRTLWRLAAPARAGPGRSWLIRSRSTSCRESSAGRWTAGRSSRCPRFTPRTPTGPASAVEPGDVPGPARGQRVRAEPRGRPPLSDPPRHRRAPRGGDPTRRAAAGERLRRRAARPDGRRGDAAARRTARAGVRRRTGGPAHSPWSRPAAACPCRPRPTSSSAARSIRSIASPRDRSATTSAITASQHDFPVLAGRTRLPSRRRHLAVHLGGPAPPGGHDLRRFDPRADRADHPQRDPRRSRRPRRRRRRSSPPAPGHRQRALRSRRRGATAPGDPDDRQRHPRPRAALAGEVPLDRRPRRRPCARHPRHSGFLGHLLERVDWRTDLHFQTQTTIDTLDYSGHG